jgi:hypothetical protein
MMCVLCVSHARSTPAGSSESDDLKFMNDSAHAVVEVTVLVHAQSIGMLHVVVDMCALTLYCRISSACHTCTSRRSCMLWYVRADGALAIGAASETTLCV